MGANVNAIGGSVADYFARLTVDMGGETGSSGFAIGASDSNNGDSAGGAWGKSMSRTGAATLRGSPWLGATCILKPGAALTSITTPPPP